jgi:hypothetical protein
MSIRAAIALSLVALVVLDAGDIGRRSRPARPSHFPGPADDHIRRLSIVCQLVVADAPARGSMSNRGDSTVHEPTNKNQKPAPLFAIPEARLCPICGKRSYSASGIHPQCAYNPGKRVAKKA